jgi:phosphatidylinositol dimannoside acyltransferase
MTLTRLRWMQLSAPLAIRFPWLFYRIAVVAGWLAWKTRPRLRRNVTRNLLPLCDGDLGRAKREGVRVCQYIAQYYVDLATLPKRDLARFERKNLEFVNPEHIAQLSVPGPIVAVSAHTGNAELAIQAINSHGRRFVAVVEAQRPPEWSRYLLKLRSAKGGTFYESDFRGVRASIEALKAGGVLGLMGDRDIQGTGVGVEICGQRVKVPRGPWELARRTGALVMPMFASRIHDDHFQVHLHEPFHMEVTADAEEDIRLVAMKWALLLEAHLRRDPGQWVVLEDYWDVHACKGAGE